MRWIGNRRFPTDENRSPLKWVEDHECKLFWTIWLPGRENLGDWHTIPAAMDFARGIHKDRLETLYVDPDNLARPTISQQRAESIIAAAEARLNMERLKEFREMEPERQDLMTWFFLAMDNPRLKPMIFSKGSFDKQAEFGDDVAAWMKWLRDTFEEADRKSMELTNLEMQRKPAEGEAGWENKFEVKIRLKSASHSIRQNQFKFWNDGIDKIKLNGGGKYELVVTLYIPKRVATQDLWNMGWQNTYVFLTALNIVPRLLLDLQCRFLPQKNSLCLQIISPFRRTLDLGSASHQNGDADPGTQNSRAKTGAGAPNRPLSPWPRRLCG